MLGLAVGDALGWPIEDRAGRVGGTAKLQPELRFSAWRRREGGRYAPHELNIRPGEYSDDTQLALAVARSRSIGPQWWEHFIQVELPLWTAYERGGGGALKRSAQSWLHSRAPWEDKKEQNIRKYLAAGGNGAVMRCLPHCLTWHAEDHYALNLSLDLDCISTHGHPRALLGSRLFAAAATWALKREEPLTYGGLVQRLLDTTPHWTAQCTAHERLFANQPHLLGDWEGQWLQAVEETIQLLHISHDGLSEGSLAIDHPVLRKLGAYGSHKGAGHVAAAAAIFLASRYASQPQQGLLAAAFARGTDTDTIASLTASLLGALHGTAWLGPLAQEVQDADYIAQITDHLLNDEPASFANEPWRGAARSKLYRWLEKPKRDPLPLGPFGQAHVADVTDYDTESLFVRSWEIHTQAGQTLFIERSERKRDGPPKWGTLPTSRSPVEKVGPRAGLILQVADLANARRFYEEVLHLTVQRVTEDYVSFGWLALEQAGEGSPPQLTTHPGDTSQLIRVYVEKGRLPHLRKEVGMLGLPTSDAPPRFKGEAFRCRDHDGHTVEFVARNSKPPTI
jgi:ADP-ribosylglycohydrolase/catechol 2,3-dioxygenase-like lactoylglutathione lyase family enzyme